MFTKLVEPDSGPKATAPKEGDLYKVIQLLGNTFEIRYGYYEDSDRYSRYAEPMEIYPDFLKEPRYTDEGIPFATAIQCPCRYFSGEMKQDNTCEDCSFFRPGEELIGLCVCPNNKKDP